MFLKMRDLPRLTAWILFRRDKIHAVAVKAVEYEDACVSVSAGQMGFTESQKVHQALYDAVRDVLDPKNDYTVCKVLLPKLSQKLRKLQDEGMYVVGVGFEEAEPRPDVVEGEVEDGGDTDRIESANKDYFMEGLRKIEDEEKEQETQG